MVEVESKVRWSEVAVLAKEGEEWKGVREWRGVDGFER